MPRFVILEHDHPHLHWDLMLEAGGVLKTWRLAKPPVELGPILAEPLGDHRIAYLDYEGPVSGGRGTVTRWDAGSYTLDPASREDRLVMYLDCGHVHGRAVLEKTSTGTWTLSLV